MAVTNYRAFGGGPYRPMAEDRLVLTCHGWVRDAVTDFVRRGGLDTLDDTPAWSLLPVHGATATIETGPGLHAHRADCAALGLEQIGANPSGFVRLRLPLFPAPCESAI